MPIIVLDPVSGSTVTIAVPPAPCASAFRSRTVAEIRCFETKGTILPEMALAQRFYFDLTNGSTILRDEEGVPASSLDQAIQEARFVLDEMRRSEELSEQQDGWTLIIRDADGNELATLPVV